MKTEKAKLYRVEPDGREVFMGDVTIEWPDIGPPEMGPVPVAVKRTGTMRLDWPSDFQETVRRLFDDKG